MSTQILIPFFITAVFLVAAGITLAYMLSPKSFNLQKQEPYECGIPTVGVTWLQFNVGYYTFALLFLIFDVETVFLFPWAVVMKQIGLVGLVEILIFFFILVLGLAYAWKKHALVWQ
ncbi:MAG TPA: NADH-quinone oxidoreductase subunit A [Tenuifilaceae bacterium]|jgi:NADH-quinone oxidoreductase subunit A|nr:NADH-quinone oxidoreductase subunit A [Bacteroidales bacterium]HNT41276.1 NADH-quinone oxidoreductase subunit A [Tenuifilaceae bacterium]MBP8643854.1 NADH-quinone oxidoreductase subunit A [Bacteroidales bacterium]HNY09090.1 NADH-quinone oxidoreductase subunit A [Tenuifilaceae bacterium]HOA10016.1 NADH-quinone oxidoreductase subunit A [Tenuifilaceae bacterium]